MGRLYRIITNGMPMEGHSPSQVLKDLSALFRTPPGKARVLLSGRVVEIRKGLDEAAARRMLAALKKAGLTCKAEPEQHGPVSAGADRSAPVRPGLSRPASEAPAAATGPVLKPIPGPGEARFSVIPGAEITASATGGLDFRKPGSTDVSPVEVTLISVYRAGTDEKGLLKALFFISGNTRPFSIEARSIKFWKFFPSRGKSTTESLRAFISFLLAGHPSLAMDNRTGMFIKGEAPRVLDIDETIHASALARALMASGLLVEGERKSAPDEALAGVDLGALRALGTEREEPEAALLTRAAILCVLVTALAAIGDIYGQLLLLKSYGVFFRGSVVNHMVMWLSVLVSAGVIASSVLALVPLFRRTGGAPRALLNHMAIFCGYTLLRFAALFASIIAAKVWNAGAIALFELKDVLAGGFFLSTAKALWYSGAVLAIPLSAAFLAVFLGSDSIKDRYGR